MGNKLILRHCRLSRNGAAVHDGEWCNPLGKKLGLKPTLDVEHEFVDAYAWIKVPGESDGKCNGGPKAGVLWAEYAKMLVSDN